MNTDQWAIMLIGVLIPYFGKLVAEVLKFMSDRKRLEPLKGKWHAYHWSRANNIPLFRDDTWDIKHYIFRGVRLETTDNNGGELRYKGEVAFEGDHTVFSFVGKEHNQESWQFRALDLIPVPGKNTLIKGILIGQDFDRASYSTLMVASNTELDEKKAKKLLLAIQDHSQSEAALRVRVCFSEEELDELNNILRS